MRHRVHFSLSVFFLFFFSPVFAVAQEATVRYYISQVLPPDQNKDYQRLALDDAVPHPDFVANIPTLPNGLAAFTWGIAYVKAIDWTGVDTDPRNMRLFAGAEGNPLNQQALLDKLSTTRWDAAGVSDTQRQKMRNLCIQLGISVVDISPSISLRQILRKVGTFLQPDFDETKFSVQ